MSKTNLYTLIATALLGVLLFVIYRFTERLPTTPVEVRDVSALQAELASVPGYAEIGVPDDGVPRINTRVDLIKLLDDLGIGGERAVAAALDWRRERGFLGPMLAFGLMPEDAPRTAFDSLDDDELETMSIDGNIGATQAMAARSVTSDPFLAMEMYERAAHQGSTFALLRIASLREAFSNPQLDVYQSDPEYLKKLSQLRKSEGDALTTEAFAYAFAALWDGGLPILDANLLQWLRLLMSNVPLNADEIACRQAERIFVRVGAARRRRGLPPVTTEPPPIFMSIPHAADQLPCADTLYAWSTTQNLDQCEVLEVENAAANKVDLFLCNRSGWSAG